MVLTVFRVCCLAIDFQRKPIRKMLQKTFFVNLLNIGMLLLEILKNIQVNLVPHQHVYIAAQQKPFVYAGAVVR